MASHERRDFVSFKEPNRDDSFPSTKLDFDLWQKIKAFCNSVFSFETYKSLKEVIVKEKPDVAHVHNVFPLLSPSVFYVLKDMNVPIVQTLHNYRYMCANGLFLTNNGQVCERCKTGSFFNAVLFKCYRNRYWQSLVMATILFIHRRLKTFSSKVDYFIAPSKFIRNKMIESKAIPGENIIVKPYVVDSSITLQGSSNGNKGYAVYLGRLSQEKGVFTLLKAWKNIQGASLKIIGEGILDEQLKNFVLKEDIKNVEFLGYIEGEQKYKIMKQAAFLIVPSEWYENMPNVILEGFACGIPIIASRFGALEEMVDDGGNGLLFTKGDSEDLKNKMEYLFKNPEIRKRMSQRARQSADTTYGVESNYQQLMAIYKKAIEKRLPA